MIEVEKKFKLSGQDIERLTRDAEFLKERTFTDIYFDDEKYSLTSNDKWLRARDGLYELKLPMHAGVDRKADQYDEIEDEQKIREVLNIPTDQKIDEIYAPFCNVTTTRKKYKKDQFIIDLDDVDYGDFKYSLGEIELLVNNQSDIEKAIAEIMDFANKYQLSVAMVRGKVIEYLKQVKPEHYQALIKAKVVKDF
ncbi:MAG: CYTH domain-containing protein [Patescibacteria group bacterium]|jgi:predicted adenylyl cyclase CyaB